MINMREMHIHPSKFSIVHSKKESAHPPKPQTAMRKKSPNALDFEIEDNCNDLVDKKVDVRIIKLHVPGNTKGSVAKQEFDRDMKKYGFEDKIRHIQKLKTNIEKQFGPCEQAKSIKILFPFQRRNRSSSPPKESPINNFNIPRANSPIPCKVIPMIAKNVELLQSKNEDFLNALESKDEKGTAESSSLDSKNDSWMYKTYANQNLPDNPRADKTIDSLMKFMKNDEV
jgi:hypothetical protein